MIPGRAMGMQKLVLEGETQPRERVGSKGADDQEISVTAPDTTRLFRMAILNAFAISLSNQIDVP